MRGPLLTPRERYGRVTCGVDDNDSKGARGVTSRVGSWFLSSAKKEFRANSNYNRMFIYEVAEAREGSQLGCVGSRNKLQRRRRALGAQERGRQRQHLGGGGAAGKEGCGACSREGESTLGPSS